MIDRNLQPSINLDHYRDCKVHVLGSEEHTAYLRSIRNERGDYTDSDTYWVEHPPVCRGHERFRYLQHVTYGQKAPRTIATQQYIDKQWVTIQ